jgi:flagellar basal-body rod modification protein FlgD
MSLIQSIVDGKVVENPNATSATKQKSGNNLDKEDFLNLLVAEMQYQDPLEPSTNTDYVAQLATFSQVEASENMVHAMEGSEANALVGKEVIMQVTSSTTGDTSFVSGPVDYVQKEGSNTYLSVNGALYNIDDLYSVMDSDYMSAYNNSSDFSKMLSMLPNAKTIDLSYATAVSQVREFYDGLSDYDKQYIDTEELEKLSELETRIKALQALADVVSSASKTDESEDEEVYEPVEEVIAGAVAQDI